MLPGWSFHHHDKIWDKYSFTNLCQAIYILSRIHAMVMVVGDSRRGSCYPTCDRQVLYYFLTLPFLSHKVLLFPLLLNGQYCYFLTLLFFFFLITLISLQFYSVCEPLYSCDHNSCIED